MLIKLNFFNKNSLTLQYTQRVQKNKIKLQIIGRYIVKNNIKTVYEHLLAILNSP